MKQLSCLHLLPIIDSFKVERKQNPHHHHHSSMSTFQRSIAPPWQVLYLVSQHLDPKTLAIASCVSKSWSLPMSSDYIWEPIFSAHFPSLSTLKLANPNLSYCRLFAIGHTAFDRRRRKKTLPKPHLSLADLIFTINISSTASASVLMTMAKPGDELVAAPDGNGVFRFDVDVSDEECMREINEGGLEEVRIAWNVVLKGWNGVFTMMDCEKKVNFVGGSDSWFSEDLPTEGCCSKAAPSGIVADFKVGLCNGKEGSIRSGRRNAKINKVSMGILNVVDWRYVSVDDGLRYLQHFLLP